MLNKLLAYSVIGGIILWLILTLSGNVFGPSIQLNDIKDVIVGDKITITGTANGIDGSQVEIILKGGNIDETYKMDFYETFREKNILSFGSEITRVDTFDIGDGYKIEAYYEELERYECNSYLCYSGQFESRGEYTNFTMGSASGYATVYRVTIDGNPTIVKEFGFGSHGWTIDIGIKTTKTGKGMHKTVNISDGKFNTVFDSFGLDGGLYQVEAISKKTSVNKTFNLILANIEDVSIIRHNDIFGTPTTVTVSLKNPSNEIKKLNLNLWLDGAFTQMTEVSIPPNSFEIVKFKLDQLSVGVHKISVGGHERLIEVKPVPFLKLDKISGEVGIGRDLTITGTSNRPDGTSALITVKNADTELIRQTALGQNCPIFSNIFKQ